MFAQDRNRLLSRYKREVSDGFATPAEALPGVLAMLGWRIEFCDLPEGKWAATDWDERAVFLATNPKLDFPTTNRDAIRNSSLAHELGHIRLHEPDRDNPHPDQEREADQYSCVFLVPRRQVVRQAILRDMVGASSDQIWSCVRRMAFRFGVTPTLMRNQLVALGILEELEVGRLTTTLQLHRILAMSTEQTVSISA